MLLSVFKWLSVQFIVFFAILIPLWVALSLMYDQAYGMRFLELIMIDMAGPWVWTFGVGLMSFIMATGPSVANELNQILEPDEIASVKATIRIEQSTRHGAALAFTVPITVIGFLLTFTYRVPHHGVSATIAYLATIVIYYVGAFLLFHFVSLIMAFHHLYEDMESVSFKKALSPLHLDNLISYLSLTTVIGLLGIYSGFRGTVTAGFHFKYELWKSFLTTPLVLFLPVTLFYNFYPRYAMRKIIQHRVMAYLNDLIEGDLENAKSVLLEIKTVASVHAHILPFLDYRSLPSYIVAIFFLISLAVSKDPALKSFFDLLLGP